MADLTIDPTKVRAVRVYEWLPDGPANEALNAGEAVRVDATSGQYTPGNGSTDTEAAVQGLSVTTADYARATISVVKRGIVDVGNALDGLDYGEEVYLSDTDGLLADTTPGTVGVRVGKVVPAWGNTTADKLLDVDIYVLPVEDEGGGEGG